MTAIHMKTWNVILVFNLMGNISYLFCVASFFSFAEDSAMMIWNLPPGIIAVDVIHEVVNVKAESKKVVILKYSCQLSDLLALELFQKINYTKRQARNLFLFVWLVECESQAWIYSIVCWRDVCVCVCFSGPYVSACGIWNLHMRRNA